MDASAKADIAAWVTESGLVGTPEPDMLRGFCERVVAAGIPVIRAVVIVDTLHPVYEGRVFRWFRDPSDLAEMHEYGRVTEDETVAIKWRQSPFYHLAETGGTSLRRRLTHNEPIDFPSIEELREQGHTDYLALVQRFAGDGVIGEMDCVSSSWSTDAPGGFQDWQVEQLRAARPGPCARHQMRLARPHRGHTGRDLSRPRRRAPGAGRTHRARSRRPDRHGAVVLRPARLHQDHRHRRTGADHPAPQRLCRSDHHRHPRRRRRRAEADRRRHARDLRGQRSGPGLPLRAGRGRARPRPGSPRSTRVATLPACP